MLAIAKEIGATRRHLPHRVESIASGPGTLCQSAITPTPHFSQPKKDTHPRRKSSAQNACRRFLMLPAQHNLHIVHIIRNVDKTKLQNYWIVMGANTQKGPPSGGRAQSIEGTEKVEMRDLGAVGNGIFLTSSMRHPREIA